MRVGGEQLWAVYQHLDIDGDVLYVGMTKNVDKRTTEHAKSAPWFIDVFEIDVIAYFDTEAKAATFERQTIRGLRPPNNLIHTGRRKRDDSKWLSTVEGVEEFLEDERARRYLAAMEDEDDDLEFGESSAVAS